VLLEVKGLFVGVPNMGLVPLLLCHLLLVLLVLLLQRFLANATPAKDAHPYVHDRLALH